MPFSQSIDIIPVVSNPVATVRNIFEPSGVDAMLRMGAGANRSRVSAILCAVDLSIRVGRFGDLL